MRVERYCGFEVLEQTLKNGVKGIKGTNTVIKKKC